MRTAERVSVSLYVDPADHERLVERARSEERSLSAELRVAIREHLSLAPGQVRRSLKATGAAADNKEDA